VRVDAFVGRRLNGYFTRPMESAGDEEPVPPASFETSSSIDEHLGFVGHQEYGDGSTYLRGRYFYEELGPCDSKVRSIQIAHQKAKFYAVKKGSRPRVYRSWNSCRE
jgi:hypothetical protein